ncbi:NVEALA domain-containing protein [Viscerimonas tarda]
MKKKIIGGLAVLTIAAVAVLNVNLSSQKELLSDILLANVEAVAQGEYNSNDRRGFLDNPLPCEIKEVYECSIGVTVPSWVPYLGGFECWATFQDEVSFPGTENHCVYTGNEDHMCDYYRCQKNS